VGPYVPRGESMGVDCHMSGAGSDQEVFSALIDPLSRILEFRIRTYVRFVCEASHRALLDWVPWLTKRLFYPILRCR